MLWLTVDFTRGIYAQAALYCVFIGFNIYGWVQWGKKVDKVKKEHLWHYGYYFDSKLNMNKFIGMNSIEHYEHRPPGCDLNPSKYHLLIFKLIFNKI